MPPVMSLITPSNAKSLPNDDSKDAAEAAEIDAVIKANNMSRADFLRWAADKIKE